MRVTLSSITPVKLASLAMESTVVFAIPNIAQTLYIAHDYSTLVKNSGGTQEGTPISNSGAGQPAFQQIKWQGDLWALGSSDAMAIDFEVYVSPPHVTDYAAPSRAPRTLWERAFNWYKNDRRTIVDPPASPARADADLRKLLGGG